MQEAEEEDDGPPQEIKPCPHLWPIPRRRSQSDTSGFCNKILLRLRGARSVDGLEKSSSLASCDVVVDGGSETQNVPRQQRGKLSSLGKLFKPWKWRKKKTSDKFQDLSKVLERKISTRQTREELIKKGVLIPDQDETVSSENLNGHATSAVASEQVKVDIESTEKQLEDPAPAHINTEEKTAAKTSNAKKTGSAAKPTSSSAISAARSRAAKSSGNSAQANGTHTKASQKADPLTPAQKTSAETPTQSSEAKSSPVPSKKRSSKATGCEVNGILKAASQYGPDKSDETVGEEDTEREQSVSSPHINATTEDTSFTEGADDSSLVQERTAGEDEDKDQKKQESPVETSSSSADELPAVKPQGHSVKTDQVQVTVIPDQPRDSQTSDSDSDGPILYRDDDEEEEDDEYLNSSLASKIRRRDTLNIKLGNRPSKKELEEKNILPRSSETERHELRQQIGSKLVRRLSQRPTTEELEQRNILKQKNEAEEQEAKQEIKRRLSRKLSVRPTVAELVARRILRFNEYVEVTDAKDYDRRADKPWTRLTPADKAAIRKELNEFKSREMEVHEDSKQFTRFHRP
ncbi:phosphatase and actin regulator 2 isoform X1 [Synchiropus splendidus]|uniref:phosphatase and actin regulator 2 isoform X1 n=1 Tax=Synchiropus splendidus TaxID=270530 RepID=UPI00237E4F03|nr:phosphatase and actin regulator 2 isoform X1 [Synchiropus splendidus]